MWELDSKIRNDHNMFLIRIAILVAFIFNSFGIMPVQAQDFVLPKPGAMVHLSPPMNPPMLKGIKVHTDNPFRFDFILDKGDVGARHASPVQEDAELKEESTRLIKYFLASLTIPEKDLWVNLSPYEKDRIVPEIFGVTEMGRDLLAQDYMLKQITASLIYPEDAVGKKFWKRIYEEAQTKYHTTNIPVNTFNKVWIVPEKAVVYENAKAGTAYVVESRLKVMLEADYLSMSKHNVETPFMASPKCKVGDGINAVCTGKDVNALGSQIVREIVIPELTKEINEGKNFAQLRQVYNSLILATWYKKKIKDSILSKVYSDKSKTQGINIDDPQEKQKIYQQYLQAFKKGVYNYIKEEQDLVSKEVIPRKYFSGGAEFTKLAMDSAMKVVDQMPADAAMAVTLRRLSVRITTVLSALAGRSAPKPLEGRLSLTQLSEKGFAEYAIGDSRFLLVKVHNQEGEKDLYWIKAFELNAQGKIKAAAGFNRFIIDRQNNIGTGMERVLTAKEFSSDAGINPRELAEQYGLVEKDWGIGEEVYGIRVEEKWQDRQAKDKGQEYRLGRILMSSGLYIARKAGIKDYYVYAVPSATTFYEENLGFQVLTRVPGDGLGKYTHKVDLAGPELNVRGFKIEEELGETVMNVDSAQFDNAQVADQAMKPDDSAIEKNKGIVKTPLQVTIPLRIDLKDDYTLDLDKSREIVSGKILFKINYKRGQVGFISLFWDERTFSWRPGNEGIAIFDMEDTGNINHRGKGLGRRAYLELINYFGVLASQGIAEPKTTEDAQRMWMSLGAKIEEVGFDALGDGSGKIYILRKEEDNAMLASGTKSSVINIPLDASIEFAWMVWKKYAGKDEVFDWAKVEADKDSFQWIDQPGFINESLFERAIKVLQAGDYLEPAPGSAPNAPQWKFNSKAKVLKENQALEEFNTTNQLAVAKTMKAVSSEAISAEEDLAYALWANAQLGGASENVKLFWRDKPVLRNEYTNKRAMVLLGMAALFHDGKYVVPKITPTEEEIRRELKKARIGYLKYLNKSYQEDVSESVRQEMIRIDLLRAETQGGNRNNNQIRVKTGFWKDAANVREAIWWALDTKVPGFEAARKSGDIVKMAQLYRQYVIGYDKNGKTGQEKFFSIEGNLGGLMTNVNPFLGKTGSAASLLRFALPDLIDEDEAGALRPWEVEDVWDDERMAHKAIIQRFDEQILEFTLARQQNNERRMADLYRRYVLNNGGQKKFYAKVGLEGLLNKKQPYLDKKGSFASLLRFAFPGIIDEDKEGVLRPWEVEDVWKDDARLAKKAVLQAYDKFIPDFAEARKKKDVDAMAAAYAQKINGKKRELYREMGLDGIMRGERPYLARTSSQNALFLFAAPEVAQKLGVTLDAALVSQDQGASKNTGGIDFNSDKMNLQLQNGGGEIKFNLNPAQLAELQNVPGFQPVILDMQPMKNLPEFLGISAANSLP